MPSIAKTFTFFLIALAAPSWAQGTYKAASCNQSDVQAAINAELANPADGDIIAIPACASTAWSGQITVTFNTSVTIQGAGALSATAGGASTTGSDLTTISSSNGAAPPAAILYITTNAGKSLRITGIAFVTTTASNGLLTILGTSAAVRVDHCHFIVTSVGLWVDGSVLGVADHNVWETDLNTPYTNPMAMHNGVGWNGSNESTGNVRGDYSWNDTDHWGTSQFFFFEDSRWTGNGAIGDTSDAARFVLRYNTITNGQQMFWHSQTAGRPRGARNAEVYQNNYSLGTSGGSNPNQSLNSGTMLYWGNTSTGFVNMLQIDYTRGTNHYPYGTPPTGWGECDASTVRQVWDGPAGSNGYPCMEQPGRGRGDLLANDFPNVVNVTQGNVPASTRPDLSPIYVWGNSFSGGSSIIYVSGPAAMIQANRDYYQSTGASCSGASCSSGIGSGLFSARPANCTAGPGGNTPGVGYWATDQSTLYVCTASNTWTAYYTPYTYPHPLTGTGSLPPARPAAPTRFTLTLH